MEIYAILKDNMAKHKISSQISSFALTDPMIDNEGLKNAYYAIVSLDFKKRKARVIGYREADYHLAFENYQERERQNNHNQQTVLVAVNKIRQLRETYPNYFMDLTTFLSIINFIIEKTGKQYKI